MRRRLLPRLLATLVATMSPSVGLALVACAPVDEPLTVCDRAADTLAACNVSLPLLHDGPCAGLRAELAACIDDNAHTCREVAGLQTIGERCLSALNEGPVDVPPPRDDATTTPPPATEDDAEACSDGIDNDDDGATDCDDFGCTQSVSACR